MPASERRAANLRRDYDADFFKLPADVRARIETAVDRLGLNLDGHSHYHMTGLAAFRLRVGDYRIVYNFDRAKGIIHLLAVGHRREVYR